MFITKEVEWDMGHRIPNHKSKCRSPHGHRYKVKVTLQGKTIKSEGKSDEGMLIDYGDIKKILIAHIHDVLDHGFMIYNKDDEMCKALVGNVTKKEDLNFKVFKPKAKYNWNIILVGFIPTAENIAKWCYDTILSETEKVFNKSLTLHSVEIYETPTSTATYTMHDYMDANKNG